MKIRHLTGEQAQVLTYGHMDCIWPMESLRPPLLLTALEVFRLIVTAGSSARALSCWYPCHPHTTATVR